MPPASKPLPSPTPTAGPAPGRVKGTLVISRMKYLRSRGPEETERVLRRLSAEDQNLLRGMLLPSSWYPADVVLRLEMTIVALLSKGERRELFVDMGRFSADANLGAGGVQRPYLRDGDPHFLLRNVPRMYSAQHAGGVRTYEPLTPTGAIVRTLEGGNEPNAEDCFTTVGWLRRAIELSGGKIVTVEETRCRARGAECCEYVCRWAESGAASSGASAEPLLRGADESRPDLLGGEERLGGRERQDRVERAVQEALAQPGPVVEKQVGEPVPLDRLAHHPLDGALRDGARAPSPGHLERPLVTGPGADAAADAPVEVEPGREGGPAAPRHRDRLHGDGAHRACPRAARAAGAP